MNLTKAGDSTTRVRGKSSGVYHEGIFDSLTQELRDLVSLGVDDAKGLTFVFIDSLKIVPVISNVRRATLRKNHPIVLQLFLCSSKPLHMLSMDGTEESSRFASWALYPLYNVEDLIWEWSQSYKELSQTCSRRQERMGLEDCLSQETRAGCWVEDRTKSRWSLKTLIDAKQIGQHTTNLEASTAQHNSSYRQNGYSQHLAKTRQPPCMTILAASRGHTNTQRSPTPMHSPSPPPAEELDQPPILEGDFFGKYEEGDLEWPDDKSDSSDEEEGIYNEEWEPSIPDTGHDNGWEPAEQGDDGDTEVPLDSQEACQQSIMQNGENLVIVSYPDAQCPLT
ncbi:hypothetical protein F4604DRAFT_1691465 [Suillus subluteus]|nr:hypothetical protein F4604DRAFT_1691465 [Suillus subluteus]